MISVPSDGTAVRGRVKAAAAAMKLGENQCQQQGMHEQQQGKGGRVVATTAVAGVTVEETPTSFSPFSLVNCMLLSHFSFNDFIAVAFPDLTGDLDAQI